MAYAEVAGAKVFHYRESANSGRNELEVDLVIEARDDEYCLIEVKLGAGQIDEAEESLMRVSEKLVAGGVPPPTAKIIVCGTVPYAYTSSKGVLVVPAGCLGM